MELKKDHSKQHDLSFVFILAFIKPEIGNLLSIEYITCIQLSFQGSLLRLDVLQNKLTLK